MIKYLLYGNLKLYMILNKNRNEENTINMYASRFTGELRYT